VPRILIRSGKRPEEVVSPETTLAANIFGANSGNYLFSHAAHRMLSRADVTLDPYGLGAPSMPAEQINEEYDHLVLPMANSFRPGYMPSLKKLTSLIESLTIPVTVLSVGAQATTDMDTGHLRALDGTVKKFVGAVLDRSPRIGVRGALTAEYLTELGFKDVEPIGCPSMFLNGPNFELRDPTPALDYDSRISFSVTPRVKEMGPITTNHIQKFRNLRLIPQDDISLAAMLWASEPKNIDRYSEMPFHPQHPLFTEDKARFFVDATPWIEYMGTIDFAFGDRIHGNVAALLAGTPAFLLAHDSRVLELAEHHKIPHMLVTDVTPDMDALTFAQMADMAPLRNAHAANWEIFSRYLADQGLAHAFDAPTDIAAFDATVAAAPLPSVVHAITGTPGIEDVSDRVQWLYRRLALSERKARTTAQTVEHLSASTQAVEPMRTQLRKQAARIVELDRAINELRATPMPRTLWSDIKPRLRKLKSRFRRAQ